MPSTSSKEQKYPENFAFLNPRVLELYTHKICKMFVCKHWKVKDKSTFLRKIQTLRVNNWRILTMKNVKFSGYYIYMSYIIKGDFKICLVYL